MYLSKCTADILESVVVPDIIEQQKYGALGIKCYIKFVFLHLGFATSQSGPLPFTPLSLPAKHFPESFAELLSASAICHPM